MSTNVSKFRNTGNQLHVYQLFHEFSTDPTCVLYSTQRSDIQVDGKDIPSFHRLIVELDDPLGYEPAMALTESVEHWEKLKSSDKVGPIITGALKEIDLKLKSEAVASMRKHAKDNYQAAKYIAERGWEEKVKAPKVTAARARRTNQPTQSSDLAKELMANRERAKGSR